MPVLILTNATHQLICRVSLLSFSIQEDLLNKLSIINMLILAQILNLQQIVWHFKKLFTKILLVQELIFIIFIVLVISQCIHLKMKCLGFIKKKFNSIKNLLIVSNIHLDVLILSGHSLFLTLTNLDKLSKFIN